MAMIIEAASVKDLPEVLRLLEQQHLPLDGVAAHVRTMLVAREDTQIVGTAALELYADGALLRSVAVDSAWQGRGIGHRLTEATLELAASRGVTDVFLLTTTAGTFFPRFGFAEITRGDVPASVQASIEFQSACPASAIVMRKGSETRSITSTVLFACVHNAGRSQMAAAWFNRLADPMKARAISAGTDPASQLHPEVVAVMREVDIDLSTARTTRLTADTASQAHLLITMGCGDQCPIVPGLRRDDWLLEDPKGKPLAQVRTIRDDTRQRVEALLDREGWTRLTR
jgi:arsenate reductase